MPSPVKIKAYDTFPFKMVEWKLHDKCNYDCYFCGPENKLGKVGWADLETNKTIIDSIIESANGNPLWIQFTGGEPTLYPDFIELLSYAKSKGAMISVISNGSRTIRWWTDLRDADVVDLLYISLHSQHTVDYRHIVDISNLFLKKETIVITLVTYVKESVEYALSSIEYLIENTANIITTNAMDLVSYRIDENTVGREAFNKILHQYNISYGKRIEEKCLTSIDLNLLPFKVNVDVENDDASVQTKNVIQMMKTKQNNFLGWTCYAGMDIMNIENGFKFRGGCKRDKTPYTPGDLKFFDKPFICDVDDCFCQMDMIATKIKNSE